MPRLRNTRTGVVVNVDEATAVTLGAGWEPVKQEAKAERPKSAARRSRKKKPDDE